MPVESGDPRIAPSTARERRAFAAGLRPRTRWLVLSGLALGLWVALEGTDLAELARWVGLNELQHSPAVALPLALERLAVGTLGIAAVVLFVVALVALATGALGPISTSERKRLVLGPIGLRGATAIAGSLGLVILALANLRGTMAGAARAPAATEAGLAALWIGTSARVLVVMIVLFALAGALEVVVSRRANRRALFQTEAQARSEARSGGSRRG